MAALALPEGGDDEVEEELLNLCFWSKYSDWRHLRENLEGFGVKERGLNLKTWVWVDLSEDKE